MRKSNFFLAMAVGLAMSASAGVEWNTDNYIVGNWRPSESNLLQTATCISDGLSYYTEDGKNMVNSPSTLTDGVVPGEGGCDYTKVCGIKGGDVTWSFAEPVQIEEVAFFTRWGDGGRDGIAVAEVSVSSNGTDWTYLAGGDASCGTVRYGLGNNDTSSALQAVLRGNPGTVLFEGALYIKIKFSDEQDNSGTGYAEIEVRGESVLEMTEYLNGVSAGGDSLQYAKDDVTLAQTFTSESKIKLVFAASNTVSAVFTDAQGNSSPTGYGIYGPGNVLVIDPQPGETCAVTVTPWAEPEDMATADDIGVSGAGATKTQMGPAVVCTFLDTDAASSFTLSRPAWAEILIVGGGGGGGMTMGGGGGAGGLLHVQRYFLPAGVYPVVVGAGGLGATVEDTSGENGGDSVFGRGLLTAHGGGGAGGWAAAPRNGASGGGAGVSSPTGGRAIYGDEGFSGGNSNDNSASGGGGAGGQGENGGANNGSGWADKAGDGGPGVLCDITGEVLWYAGGGGAGAGIASWLSQEVKGSSNPGAGGSGVGGAGASLGSQQGGENALDGRGGGGGGGGYGNGSGPATPGGNGGSGTIIVRIVDTGYDDPSPYASVAVDEVGASTMSVTASIQYFGYGQTELELVLKYGSAADSLEHETTFGSALTELGTVSLTTTAFSPGRSYVGRFYARNAGGLFALGEPFAFKTTSVKPMPYGSRAGLLQGATYGNHLSFDIVNGTSWGLGISQTAAAAYAVLVDENNRDSWTVDHFGEATGTCAWLSDVTIGYTGYMFFDDVTYTIGENMDDNARVVINGVEILNAGGSGGNKDPVCATWTPPNGAGWYPISIWLYNGWGGAGPFAGFDGLAWNTVGDTSRVAPSWRRFADPGNGSLLRYEKPLSLQYMEVGRYDDSGFYALVQYPANGELAGYDAVVLASETCSENLADWTVVSSAAVDSADVAKSFHVELPSDAQFVRIAFRKLNSSETAFDWVDMPVLYYGELPAVSADEPRAMVADVAPGDGETAVVSYDVTYLGSIDSIDLEFHYGIVGAADERTAVVANVGFGAGSTTLRDLRPGRRYFVNVVPCKGGVKGSPSESFVYDAPSTRQPNHVDRLPGLWQVKLAGGGQRWDVDVLSVAVGSGEYERRRELGAMMAYQTGSHVSELSGLSSWWSGNTTFLYAGYMRFTQGTYKFASSQDDYAFIAVNGTTVLSQPIYTQAHGEWDCPVDGWYPVKLGVGNDGSNAGPFAEPNPPFSYSTDGGETWHSFLDPGDGSLLCTYPSALPMLVNCTVVDGALEGTIELRGESDAASEVWVDASATPEYGAGVKVGEVSTTDASFALEEFPLNGAKYVTVFLKSGGGVCVGNTLFVPSDDQAQLSETASVDASAGDHVVVNGYLLFAGGGDTAEVKIRMGLKSDLSDAVEYMVGDLAAGSSFARTIPGAGESALLPGTNYYYQVVATGSEENARQDATPIMPFYLEGAAEFSANITAVDKVWNGEFTGSLSDVGAGMSAEVSLFAGYDPDSLVLIETKTVTSTSSFMFTHEFDGVNKNVYWKFVVSNGCATDSWTRETATNTLYLNGSLTYLWRDDVLEGDWNNPANWLVSRDGEWVADQRAGYPNNASAVVRFDSCTNGPVNVVVGGGYDVVTVSANTPGVDVTLKSAVGTKFYLKSWDDTFFIADGACLTLDGLSFDAIGPLWGKNIGSTLRFINGADAYFGRELWYNCENTRVVVANGAKLRTGYCLQWAAHDSELVIDDSQFSQFGNCLSHFVMNNDSTNQVLRLKGANPSFSVPGMRLGVYKSENTLSDPLKIVFEIPEDGWTTAPITCSGGSFGPLFGWAKDYIDETGSRVGQGSVEFAIDGASPFFAVSGSHVSKLVSWPQGIAVDRVVGMSAGHGGAEFYWTFGENDALSPSSDGELPTGLWVRYQKLGIMIIVR